MINTQIGIRKVYIIKSGGLNINESGSGMGSVLTDIVKQMGKKVIIK